MGPPPLWVGLAPRERSFLSCVGNSVARSLARLSLDLRISLRRIDFLFVRPDESSNLKAVPVRPFCSGFLTVQMMNTMGKQMSCTVLKIFSHFNNSSLTLSSKTSATVTESKSAIMFSSTSCDSEGGAGLPSLNRRAHGSPAA